HQQSFLALHENSNEKYRQVFIAFKHTQKATPSAFSLLCKGNAMPASTRSKQAMIFKEHTEPLETLCRNLDYKILFRKTTELQELKLKCQWKKIQIWVPYPSPKMSSKGMQIQVREMP
ncbi:unnamed protein product, partial [Bubo scandiacus]